MNKEKKTNLVETKLTENEDENFSSANKEEKIHGVTVHREGEIDWWFDARKIENEKIINEAEKSNCTHIVLEPSQIKKIKTKKQCVIFVEKIEFLKELSSNMWVMAATEEIYSASIKNGFKTGRFMIISDLEKEFPECVQICERGDEFLVIDIEHATYIPYELLLAKSEKSRTKIIRPIPIKGLNNYVSHINQSLNAFSTMEKGISVLYHPIDAESILSLTKNLISRQMTKIALVSAEVVEVQHTGLGHRVCVDTTSFMAADEGLIIGSTGWGGIMVSSETHYLPHMNLREFRVNAGAVHSYVWSKNETAVYLSELEAGSEVLCVNRKGEARVVTVGRAKIERRPMLKIKCRVELNKLSSEIRKAAINEFIIKKEVTPLNENIAGADEKYIYINTFLQNDWHVRVMGSDGKVKHNTLLQPGDKLLAYIDIPGRHTGLRVTEHIIEK